MKNSWHPLSMVFVALGAIVALNTIVGTYLFYSNANSDRSYIYIQYSLMINPFGYWHVALSLLAFAMITQTFSDYHAYLYESKIPLVARGAIFTLAVLILLVAAGGLIFLLFVEIVARSQLSLSEMRQSQSGFDSRIINRSMQMRIFPYNIVNYLVPTGNVLVGVMLLDLGQRIERLRNDAEQSDVLEAAE
jgi:hypothetical protein